MIDDAGGAPAIIKRLGGIVVLCACLLLVACGSSKAPDKPAPKPPVIGFIYVGSTDDMGYNQAAHDGAMAVRRAFPAAGIIEAQHVPENAEAATVMQGMVDRGATIIFATSFGHMEPALEVAAQNPDVTFLHQGGQQTAANLGTYFGTIWEAEYAAGQAAGLATHSDRLGFVAAFPIAQSLLSINAYELGAQSVNARARTRVLFTSSWCAPAKQRAAAERLLRWGADVLTQHQDCTAAVIKAAADAHALTTGYHYDAHTLAPQAWLTGARWNWGPMFVDIVRTIQRGAFASSRYAGRLRVGMTGGEVALAPFGPAATPRLRQIVARTAAALRAGTVHPFDGPVRDQRGALRIPGREPSTTQLEETDYLVEGVVGAAR